SSLPVPPVCSRKTYAAGTTRNRSVTPRGSARRVAVAGLLLGEVLRLVDLAGVLVTGLVVDHVASLLGGLVDLVVVLVDELLGVVEKTHGAEASPVAVVSRRAWNALL